MGDQRGAAEHIVREYRKTPVLYPWRMVLPWYGTGSKCFISMLRIISIDYFLMGRFLPQIPSHPQPRPFHHRKADCDCSLALVTHPHLRPHLLDTLSRSGNWRYRFSLYHLGALSDFYVSLLSTKTCVSFVLRSPL